MKFDRSIKTSGNGLWSDVIKTVKTTDLELDAVKDGDGRMWGELMIHFDESSWNVNEDGLIYTDKGFMDELREELAFIGLSGPDVTYSEQGMQGRNYVSCDVGEDFIETWMAKDPDFQLNILGY